MITNLNRLQGVQGRPSPLGYRQQNFGIANRVDEAKATGSGALTKAEIPDPLGIRKKYADAPVVISCLDRIWRAVRKFNQQDGKEPLNLAGANLSALNDVRDNDGVHVNLQSYILSLGAKRQYPLDGADLDGAILCGVCLNQTHLTGVNLSRAHLTRADLTGANLFRACLLGAYLYKGSEKITGNELREYLKTEFPTITGLDSAKFE